MNGRVPHPIPYQGSKQQIAPSILPYFPPCLSRLVEPFAGSAAISIAVGIRHRAKRFWINDAHGPLIELWREILSRPDDLAASYERLWNDQIGRERAYYDVVRDRFNATHQPADFLYLLARCVKAVIRYNTRGQFNNTPDNRRRGARPSEMRNRILSVSELLAGKIELTSYDYKKVLKHCEAPDLICMDPPYQGVCGDRDQRYAPKFNHQEFCDELSNLNDRGIMFIVSYDGRTGDKIYGEPLPKRLGLVHLEIFTGRSSQATLLGREHVTYESLYLSPALATSIEYGKHRRKLQQSFA